MLACPGRWGVGGSCGARHHFGLPVPLVAGFRGGHAWLSPSEVTGREPRGLIPGGGGWWPWGDSVHVGLCVGTADGILWAKGPEKHERPIARSPSHPGSVNPAGARPLTWSRMDAMLRCPQRPPSCAMREQRRRNPARPPRTPLPSSWALGVSRVAPGLSWLKPTRSSSSAILLGARGTEGDFSALWAALRPVINNAGKCLLAGGSWLASEVRAAEAAGLSPAPLAAGEMGLDPEQDLGDLPWLRGGWLGMGWQSWS